LSLDEERDDEINGTGLLAIPQIDASADITNVVLEDVWNIESIGIVDKQTENDDFIAKEQFKESGEFKDGRYYVSWPWKETTPELPVNRKLAIDRLKWTINRLKNKPELLTKYDSVIKDQFEKGVIEQDDTRLSEVDGLVHYLNHHAVVTSQTTMTKLRVVYDASAKTKKKNNSLNDCLYRGPVMLPDLTGMLMRFRLHR